MFQLYLSPNRNNALNIDSDCLSYTSAMMPKKQTVPQKSKRHAKTKSYDHATGRTAIKQREQNSFVKLSQKAEGLFKSLLLNTTEQHAL